MIDGPDGFELYDVQSFSNYIRNKNEHWAFLKLSFFGGYSEE